MAKIKERLKTLAKKCSICNKSMRVIVYKNRAYRGGHYFGKIPLYKKAELQKAIKAGTRQTRIGKMTVNVFKKDPNPYKYAEYWECPQCYW